MISREESDLLFAQLDTDGNGSLNFIEAKAGSKKLKVLLQNPRLCPRLTDSRMRTFLKKRRFVFPGHKQAVGLNTAVHAFWAVADVDGDKNLTKVSFATGRRLSTS
jgi:hypothetical protein